MPVPTPTAGPPAPTRAFTPAWLADDPAAAGWIPLDFRRAEDRAAAARDAAAHVMPPGLLAAFAQQQALLPPCSARAAALDKLGQPGAMAVVTGQQVGLWLGPLYTLYKAASALTLARHLEAEQGRPCVAVFWLQTEDHDFPEIRRAFTPGPGGPESYELEDALGRDGALRPVRARALGADATALLDRLAEQLRGQPHEAEVISLLGRHYRPGATLAGAFAGVLAELFAGEGLLILDPSAAELAPLAAPVHRRAFDSAAGIADGLGQRSVELAGAGLRVQVHVRPEAPLSFWHRAGPNGSRYRLEPAGPERWRLCGTEQTVLRSEVSDDLARRPERFSTSALLRPLLQDTWLPTVAYVGGPGECGYFAQLAPGYEAFGRPLPLVVPRARFTLVTPQAQRLCEQLGLLPGDAALARDELLARVVLQSPEGLRSPEGLPGPSELESTLLGQAHATLEAFGAQARELDPGLAKAAARLDVALAEQVARLIARYRRVLAERDEVSGRRVERFRALLAPDGAPQERVYGFASFAAGCGTRALVRRIMDNAAPLGVEPKLLEI